MRGEHAFACIRWNTKHAYKKTRLRAHARSTQMTGNQESRPGRRTWRPGRRNADAKVRGSARQQRQERETVVTRGEECGGHRVA